jgi:hypothetical protein
MSEKQVPAAQAKQEVAKAGAPPAAVAAPARPAASGELDLEIEEIQRPELMKEGFVGQER